jgi:hypothetical protein
VCNLFIKEANTVVVSEALSTEAGKTRPVLSYDQTNSIRIVLQLKLYNPACKLYCLL